MKYQQYRPAAIAALALGCVLSTLPAAAQTAEPTPPAMCQTKPQRATKYGSGVAKGKQRVDNIFAAADVGKNPNKLRKKLDRVLDKLHDHVREVWDSDVSDGRRCRVQGAIDGFLHRLAQILGQCVFDGAQWAEFAANVYCELSIELDGLGEPGPFLRPPVSLCGTLFQQVCDESYAYIATEASTPMSPRLLRFVQDRGLSLEPYPGCREFTQAPYDQVYREARMTDCAY